jgi:hypothetical protein
MTQKYLILQTYGKLAIPVEAMGHLSGMKLVDERGYGDDRRIYESASNLQFEMVSESEILPPKEEVKT